MVFLCDYTQAASHVCFHQTASPYKVSAIFGTSASANSKSCDHPLYIALQACIEYLDMLRSAYGPELVLDPHVLPMDVFDISDDAGQLLLWALLHLQNLL